MNSTMNSTMMAPMILMAFFSSLPHGLEPVACVKILLNVWVKLFPLTASGLITHGSALSLAAAAPPVAAAAPPVAAVSVAASCTAGSGAPWMFLSSPSRA